MTRTLDQAPSPVAEDADTHGHAGRRGQDLRRRLAKRVGWGAAGAVALGIGYVPAARVPLIADDLQATYEIYAVSNGNLWDAVTFGVSAGTRGGHFNPIGQALGATYHYAAYWVSAGLGISPQVFDVLAYLVLIAVTIAGATSMVVWGLRRNGRDRPAYWPLFALICAITAATLQIHAPWSNDPVVSFGPAGWGSAALGFWTIAWGLRAVSPGVTDRRPIVVCSALAITCVWYYEMLVAAVAALALGLVMTALLSSDRAAVRRRCLVLLGTAVLLPAVLFVAGRQLTAAIHVGYGGTTVTLGVESLRTWAVGMIGALPGGGWDYLSSMAGAPAVRDSSLLVAGALTAVVGLIGLAWARSSAGAPHSPGTAATEEEATPGRKAVPAYRSPVLVLLAVIIAYWALATATHSVTAKYIEEIQHPGNVYLFYAVGVVAVATLLALALDWLRRRPWSVLLLGLLPLVGAFVLGQVAVNTAVADAVHRVYPLNAPLVGASTDPGVDVDARCAVLEGWWLQPWWPEYYSSAVGEDIQENFERMYGEEFCPRLGGGPPPGLPPA